MTVESNIAFGLDIKGMAADQKQAIVTRLLDKLGLSDFRDRYFRDLSGGMRQRVAIARVLALDPPLMLMDEPFSRCPRCPDPALAANRIAAHLDGKTARPSSSSLIRSKRPSTSPTASS